MSTEDNHRNDKFECMDDRSCARHCTALNIPVAPSHMERILVRALHHTGMPSPYHYRDHKVDTHPGDTCAHSYGVHTEEARCTAPDKHEARDSTLNVLHNKLGYSDVGCTTSSA
eukprot:1078544_1